MIVESHPALVGPARRSVCSPRSRASRGRAAARTLEVAMGLETAHPDGARTPEQADDARRTSRSAADALARRGVALRVFLLIAPPFVPADEQDEWLLRSVDAAFACGASVVSLVPTRPGNGAMEALAAAGRVHARRRSTTSSAASTLAPRHAQARPGVRRLWDLERFASCPHCLAARRERLARMNLEQRVLPPIVCATLRASVRA